MTIRTLAALLTLVVACGDSAVHVDDVGDAAAIPSDGSNAQPGATSVELALEVVGAGSVVSSPAGIDCGATCTASFAKGTAVTLTATPAAGSVFTGWTGACAGSGTTCAITLAERSSATASFAIGPSYDLSITTAGTGTGVVTSSPAGIDCGTTCSHAYGTGQLVTLTATADASSTFAGWGGACTGNAGCTVTMDAAKAVTATFTRKQVTLTVTKTGNGTGSITGASIDCPSDCTEVVDYGTTIALDATSSIDLATASTFSGWTGGGCSGTAGCSVTLNADTTVSAGFKLRPNYMFVTSTAHTGNLGGLAGADGICAARAAAANRAGTYVAYLSSFDGVTAINAPARVGSASGWVRVDGVPVMNAITELAAGTAMNAPKLTETEQDITELASAYVWTGTSSLGVYANACSPPSTPSPWGGTSNTANVGLSTSTTSTAVFATTSSCNVAAHLYCLGIDRAATVP